MGIVIWVHSNSLRAPMGFGMPLKTNTKPNMVNPMNMMFNMLIITNEFGILESIDGRPVIETGDKNGKIINMKATKTSIIIIRESK